MFIILDRRGLRQSHMRLQLLAVRRTLCLYFDEQSWNIQHEYLAVHGNFFQQPTVCDQLLTIYAHIMRHRIYVTVGRLSVRLSVLSIDSSNGGRRVCCWTPCRQEISTDSCGRRAAGASTQQQMQVASCWEPTKEAQQRFVRFVITCDTYAELFHFYFMLFFRHHAIHAPTAVWAQSRFLVWPTSLYQQQQRDTVWVRTSVSSKFGSPYIRLLMAIERIYKIICLLT